MKRKNWIYLLSVYSNKNNLISIRTQFDDKYYIQYSDDSVEITIEETNSIIGDEYVLCFQSGRKFIAERINEDNRKDSKEVMIHHTETGHKGKHLQFTLYSVNIEKIRILLDYIDDEDYEKCIKGFLHICTDLIQKEQICNHISINIKDYFFDSEIETLVKERKFLITKIKDAYFRGNITDTIDRVITGEILKKLQTETYLQPFLDWKE